MSDWILDNNDNANKEDESKSLSLLNMAKTVHDNYITEASQKAEDIVNEANLEAERITVEAQRKAEDIVNEAIQEYNSYSEAIEKLKRIEIEYRARLKNAADDTLVSLEKMTESGEDADLSEEESFAIFNDK